MRLLTFSSRNAKEILRDPLNVAFSLGFPVILLFLMSAIGANAPVSIFEIETLTPGITVFGLSFMTLFSATLIARDRETALLQRLYTTPLTSADFIFGYVLPILPIAVAQCALCYIAAVMLGLTWSVYIVYAVLLIIPVSLFFIALGLLFGSAIIRFISKFRVEGDHEKIEGITGLILSLYGIIAIIVCIVGFVLTKGTGLFFGTGLTSAEIGKLKILMIIMTVSTALSFPVSILSSVSIAYEKYIFRKMVDMVNTSCLWCYFYLVL